MRVPVQLEDMAVASTKGSDQLGAFDFDVKPWLPPSSPPPFKGDRNIARATLLPLPQLPVQRRQVDRVAC